MKLLVLGGNGFVGKAICRAGLRRNWQVTSLSRHGSPVPIPSDLSAVSWKQGSALDQNCLKVLADDKEYVVHCVGTLFDAPNGQTCDLLNHQTLSSLLKSVEGSSVKGIGYLSAAQFDPLTSSLMAPYYSAKRKAEEDLTAWNGGRKVILRPGVIYGRDRPASFMFAIGTRVMGWFTAGLIPPPVQVDRLADHLLDALQSESSASKIIYESKEI